MHILVAAKQVLDPDGVNSYALWGRLAIDSSGTAFDLQGNVPNIINAYDEQALEAALRIRDSGVETTITAVSVGPDSCAEVLKRCLATGADKAVHVRDTGPARSDGFRTARLLAAAARQVGPIDLVLCGRQGSDYDQGIVPGALSEYLGAALITVASDVRSDGSRVTVERVGDLGREVLEATLPAVVSVSNEIGTPRYPTSRGMLEARRKQPLEFDADELLGDEGRPSLQLVALSVPDIQGHCQMVEGGSPAEQATALIDLLERLGAARA